MIGLVLIMGDFEDGLDAYLREDYEKAFDSFKKLAEQGNADAQSQLGEMYEFGLGIAQDEEEAVKLYRLSAEQNIYFAQFRLGEMYRYGDGVQQDYVQAYMWYNLAGGNGDEVAIKFRRKLEKKMTPRQIEKAQKLAREWIEEH